MLPDRGEFGILAGILAGNVTGPEYHTGRGECQIERPSKIGFVVESGECPPLEGYADLTHIRDGIDIDAANAEAVRRICVGRPMLVDIGIVRDVIAGFAPSGEACMLITWERMCGLRAAQGWRAHVANHQCLVVRRGGAGGEVHEGFSFWRRLQLHAGAGQGLPRPHRQLPADRTVAGRHLAGAAGRGGRLCPAHGRGGRATRSRWC